MKTTAAATQPVTKPGPGEYRPDTAFLRIEDLPKPKIMKEDRNESHRPCPTCGQPARREHVYQRRLHDVGDLVSGRPVERHITYSQHHCKRCNKYFCADLSDVAPLGSHYTDRVIALALRVVVEDGLAYRNASWHLWRDHRVFVPFATIQNWVEAGGKRASERWESDYLAWALADFSGYLAADELYDGPFCILSLVDNRTFKRLFFRVLDHDPTQEDMIAFFGRFQNILQARQVRVQGITTDGSALYPAAIRAVWGELPHQICEFHILHDLNQAILRVLAQVRKQLAAQQPKLGRGRPTANQRKLVQKRQRLQQKIADLFEHRYLFVQHHLTDAERATLQQITRGLPHLRVLRQITDQICRLFDRRCRTATALTKLAVLRQRVQRFSKLSQILKG
jgi:transposase